MKGLDLRKQRARKANALIEVIAGCGRRFFHYQGRVSSFELDARGRIWLIDNYTEARIYTHKTGRWRGFALGGTLKSLCEVLRDWIMGRRPWLAPKTFGPWPEWVCGGDLWGYGDDMQHVRSAAQALGIVPKDQPQESTT